jgi:hypothetical protein
LQLYRRYPLLFLVLALGVVGPYELIVLAVTGRSPFSLRDNVSTTLILSLINFVVVGPLVSALYVGAVQKIGRGEAPHLGQVAVRGVTVLPTVAAAQIIATLGIAAGLLAFIVPGVYLLIRWAVVAQVAAIDNDNWISALKRSGELTAGNYLHVLGLIFVAAVIAAVVANLGLAAAGSRVTAGAIALGIAVETIARSFVALTLSVLFFDLLARQAAR